MVKLTKNDKYWRKRKIDWERAYWREHPHRELLIEVLKSTKFEKLLEIGCGAGINLYLAKKAIPGIKIAGCDINEDAVKTAREKLMGADFEKGKIVIDRDYDFEKGKIVIDRDYPDWEKLLIKEPRVEDIEIRAGNATELPFHGASFDIIMTDACLIYIPPKNIGRVLREIRRVGSRRGVVVFIEFHSQNPLKRLALRATTRYYAYDYEKLLKDYYFKHIKVKKLTKEYWEGEPWETYGYLITATI